MKNYTKITPVLSSEGRHILGVVSVRPDTTMLSAFGPLEDDDQLRGQTHLEEGQGGKEIDGWDQQTQIDSGLWLCCFIGLTKADKPMEKWKCMKTKCQTTSICFLFCFVSINQV